MLSVFLKDSFSLIYIYAYQKSSQLSGVFNANRSKYTDTYTDTHKRS